MTDKSDEKKLVLHPDLVKFANTANQYNVLENIEVCIEKVGVFVKSNKKKDFEDAVDYLNETLESVKKLANSGDLGDRELVDIIHDALLLPSYILQYTARKNQTEKNVG